MIKINNVSFIRQDNQQQYNDGGISSEEYQEQDEALKQAEDLYAGQDMTRLAKVYLDENVPSKINRHDLYINFWAVHGNTLKLTFLSEDDVEIFELRFQKAVALWKMSQPSYQINFNDLQVIEQMKIYMIATLKRSVGSEKHRINERTMQTTHISQNIRSNTERMGNSQGKGIMGKLRGWF